MALYVVLGIVGVFGYLLSAAATAGVIKRKHSLEFEALVEPPGCLAIIFWPVTWLLFFLMVPICWVYEKASATTEFKEPEKKEEPKAIVCMHCKCVVAHMTGTYMETLVGHVCKAQCRCPVCGEDHKYSPKPKDSGDDVIAID